MTTRFTSAFFSAFERNTSRHSTRIGHIRMVPIARKKVPTSVSSDPTSAIPGRADVEEVRVRERREAEKGDAEQRPTGDPAVSHGAQLQGLMSGTLYYGRTF
ncbi:MAG: hypothetical protein U1E76_27100 [Planctomycetota bacterium]